MKKGNVLMIGFLIVFFVLVGFGIYYFLNKSAKVGEESQVQKPVEETFVPTATPTLTLQEDLNSIQISTDDAELRELQDEAGKL